MKKIKKIIREILNEIFDNLEIPKNLLFKKTENSFTYSFLTKNNNYCVLFDVPKSKLEKTPANKLLALTKKDEINDVIISNNNIFFLSWGTCDENNTPIDNIKTNYKEELFVFNSVFAIIKKFLEEHNPDIIFYQAIDKRKLIYDKMFNKMNMNNYLKIEGIMNTFLIKKELL